LERVQQGSKVGLVSDAGTPAVSDPGSELVRACHRAGLRVVAIPGASAVTTAVCASGLVEGPFLFLGFLPRRGTQRDALLKRICDSTEPCIVFESPLRVQATLRELAQLIPEREACVARELSKLHEEVRVASLRELAEQAQWRGECTLVISGSTAIAQAAEPPDEDLLRTEIATALAAGASTKALADALAERLGRPRKEMYSLVLQMREPARERPAKAR
jgi:16S rRNA (cytidine1402-2'-O)-methyltransferase